MASLHRNIVTSTSLAEIGNLISVVRIGCLEYYDI